MRRVPFISNGREVGIVKQDISLVNYHLQEHHGREQGDVLKGVQEQEKLVKCPGLIPALEYVGVVGADFPRKAIQCDVKGCVSYCPTE